MDPQKVKERMMALCSRREYCSSDIMKKVLSCLDGNVEQARDIVTDLIKDKYIDDFRFASAYARDKASIAGWGKSKIRYMLASKGVAKETIDAALIEIDMSKADERFEKLLRNKALSLKGDVNARIKLLRFSMGRGYSYDEADNMIGKILK